MSPPERTFGPIGWKGIFGDDDGESGDEESTRREGSAGADGRSTDAGREVPRRSGTEEAIQDERARRARELSDADAGRDADADPLDDWKTLEEMASEDRDEATGDPEDVATETGDTTDGPEASAATDAATGTSRDESPPTGDDEAGVVPEWTDASSGTSDAAGDGAETADTEDDGGLRDRIDAFYARYFLPPSVTDEDLGDEEPTDAEAGSESGIGTTSSAGTSAGSETTSSEGTSAGPETTPSEGTDAGSETTPSTGPTAGTAGDSGRGTAGTTDRTERGGRDRPTAENAAPPRSEPRVRTSGSGTEPEPDTGSTSERTFGPVGLKWLSGDEDEPESVSSGDESTRTGARTASGSTTDAAGRSAGTVDLDRHRTPATDETTTSDESLTSRIPWSVSVTAIAVGVGLLVFIDIVSMMVPLLAAIGAGIVGGFVAGYIAGGTFRGGMHALAVGVIGGIAVGYLTALVGALLGLFLEPATLLGSQVGPITPDLGTFGAWGPLLVMVLVTAMVAIDATIAGVVGGTLRSMVDEVR